MKQLTVYNDVNVNVFFLLIRAFPFPLQLKEFWNSRWLTRYHWLTESFIRARKWVTLQVEGSMGVPLFFWLGGTSHVGWDKKWGEPILTNHGLSWPNKYPFSPPISSSRRSSSILRGIPIPLYLYPQYRSNVEKYTYLNEGVFWLVVIVSPSYQRWLRWPSTSLR